MRNHRGDRVSSPASGSDVEAPKSSATSAVSVSTNGSTMNQKKQVIVRATATLLVAGSALAAPSALAAVPFASSGDFREVAPTGFPPGGAAEPQDDVVGSLYRVLAEGDRAWTGAYSRAYDSLSYAAFGSGESTEQYEQHDYEDLPEEQQYWGSSLDTATADLGDRAFD